MSDQNRMNEEDLLQGLAEAVLKFNVQRAGELAQTALDRDFSARRAVLEGLAAGMRQVGERFKCQEYFVPEVLLAARAMYRGLNLLKPRMLEEGGGEAVGEKGKLAIAVVEGDLHDIGKNIVRIMLEAEGFVVLDLGKNSPLRTIFDALDENFVKEGSTLALSTLMTTTLTAMERTVAEVKSKFPDVKIMVGGAPVTAGFARDIGADGTAEDASGAVELALKLSGRR